MGKYNKQQYVNDSYIETIEHYLHNDLDLKELYEEEKVQNLDAFKELLIQGEEIIPLFDNYAITNYCRVFNVKLIRQLSPNFYEDKNVSVCLHTKKQDIKKLFAEQGWDYNIPDIKKIYDKNKWKYGRLGNLK